MKRGKRKSKGRSRDTNPLNEPTDAEDYNDKIIIAQKTGKLIISGSEHTEDLAVSIEKLYGIPHINLKNCKLIGISYGEVVLRVQPMELILKDIIVNEPERFDFGNFLYFHNLQVLHLDLSCYPRPSLNFSDCVTIKSLILTNIKINLNGKISPKMLQLKDNVYFKAGTSISPCYINDHLLEGTHLDQVILEDEKIIFDFGISGISVDDLRIEMPGSKYYPMGCIKSSIKGGEIRILHLTMKGTIFYGGRKQLEDSDYSNRTGIDISWIPSSLQSLKIEKYEDYHTFSSSKSVPFPNLTQLRITGRHNKDNFSLNNVAREGDGFYLFANCPALADVVLIGLEGFMFPKSEDFPALKRLVLWDMEKMLIDRANYLYNSQVYNLDVLVLSSSNFPFNYHHMLSSMSAFQVFAKFKAKLFVFFRIDEKIQEDIVTQLIILKENMNLKNIIAFGPVEWSCNTSFQQSLLFSVVKTKSEFYLLEGEGGKSISKEQLMDMLPTNIHNDMSTSQFDCPPRYLEKWKIVKEKPINAVASNEDQRNLLEKMKIVKEKPINAVASNEDQRNLLEKMKIVKEKPITAVASNEDQRNLLEKMKIVKEKPINAVASNEDQINLLEKMKIVKEKPINAVAINEDQRNHGNTIVFIEKNPLNIEVILQILLEMVDYKTIKAGRQVSRKWKRICDPLLIAKSAFAFENKNSTTKKISSSLLKYPVKIQSLFGSMDRKVHFEAFKFQHDLLTTPVLEMYLYPNEKTMTHLEIVNNGTKAKAGHKYNNVDKWISRNLRKIVVSGSEEHKDLHVSLRKLASIPRITLKLCRMDDGYENEVKMRPTELTIKNVWMYTFNIKMNDIIDFRNLQLLHLDFQFNAERGRLPRLKFSECVNIKSLVLIGIEIHLDAKIAPQALLQLKKNDYSKDGQEILDHCYITDYILEGAQLDKVILQGSALIFDFGHSISVNELRLTSIDRIINTVYEGEMNIKNLVMDNVIMYKVSGKDEKEDGIDISILPFSLQSLEIRKKEFSDIWSSKDYVCFPFLTRLRINSSSRHPDDDFLENVSEFTLFANCPVLSDVVLIRLQGALFQGIKAEFPALRNFVLWDAEKMLIDRTKHLHPNVINLDLLILSSTLFDNLSSINFLIEILTKLKAKFVVFYKFNEKVKEKNITMMIRMKQNMKLEKIAFGPVEWETKDSFQKSLVFPIAKIKSEFYLLEGGGGKAISESDLMKMVPDNIYKLI